MECWEKIVVRRGTGKDVAKKERMVLLCITTLHVSAYVGCYSLAGCRHAARTWRQVVTSH